MYYAVRKGRNPGIYNSWDECKENVNKFKGAEFHKFKTIEEAKDFMKNVDVNNDNELFKFNYLGDNFLYPHAFIDGSYNQKEKIYGWGGYLKIEPNSKMIKISGSGSNSELALMRNVSGELMGAISVINKAISLKLKSINIYYDYEGIEKWANKKWNTSKNFIKKYISFVEKARKSIDINFIKVPAHTGIEGNELADNLAKKAVER